MQHTFPYHNKKKNKKKNFYEPSHITPLELIVLENKSLPFKIRAKNIGYFPEKNSTHESFNIKFYRNQ